MSDPVIRFDGLTRWYGEHCALDTLTLDVERGDVFALLGRNGAGKTTALRCLLGLQQPTRGGASILGFDSTEIPPCERGRIGFVAEGSPLVPWMRITALRDFQAATVDGFDRDVFDRHVRELGLNPKARVKSLSRGQRAQVALAAALASRPEVLVLDDPAMGLDPVVRREFLTVVIELVQQEGRTVLFTSHILADVERVAGRVAILDRGVLRALGDVDALKQAVVRVDATFDGDAPPVCDVDGVLRVDAEGRHAAVTTCRGPAAVVAWANACGAETVDVATLSLEDLFVAYTTARPVVTAGAER